MTFSDPLVLCSRCGRRVGASSCSWTRFFGRSCATCSSFLSERGLWGDARSNP